MRRIAVLVVALALALTIVVAGCSKPQQEETPAGPAVTKAQMPTDTGKKGTAANPWVIGMSQCNLGEPWRIRMNDDIKKADEIGRRLDVGAVTDYQGLAGCSSVGQR